VAAPHANGMGRPGGRMAKLVLENRFLGLPGTANAALIKFMSALSSRVGRAKLTVRLAKRLLCWCQRGRRSLRHPRVWVGERRGVCVCLFLASSSRLYKA
jgi:hypothetical protein